MKKVLARHVTFLVLFLLVSQFFFPIAKAFASSTMLPPSNLAIQYVTPDDIKLTWSAVNGANGYNVYEITEGQLILHGKTTSTSYNLNNLAEGSYRYVVSTLGPDGESGPSAPVSAEIEYPVMETPVTLTHTLINGNDIVLNWSASNYVEKYNVYQISENGPKTLLDSTTSRTYTFSNVAEGNYTYAVSAENSLYGESPSSTTVSVEVIYPTMNVPSNFTYTVTNGNDVTLKWDAVPYAKNYNLYQIIDNEKVLINTVTGTSIKFTNAPAGDYQYEIRSNSDRFGESSEGNQLQVKVDTITMEPPTNFTYKLQNINDIVLTWGSVPYAKNYKVYQIVEGEKVLKSTVTGTSVTFAKAEAGDYQFEVHSYSDRFGESAEGSKVSLTVNEVSMEAPANFTYEIQSGNDIVLNWESTTNTTNYKIYQIIDGSKILKSTVSGTSVRFSNMPEGEYTYEIHSNSTRFGESIEGSKLTLSLEHPTMVPPSNLAESIANYSDVTLRWDAAENANYYRVYQIIDGKKVLKNTTYGTSITYWNLPVGEYTYEVYSNSSRFGESAEGTRVTFTLTGPEMQAPTNQAYTIVNGNDVKLSWSAAEFVTNYKIYQIIDGEKVLKNTITGTAITYSKLPEGDYKYVIHSYSSMYGESEIGAELTISLVHPIMEAPELDDYKIQNGNDVVLKWDSVEFANSYKVYEFVDGQKELLRTTSSLSTTLSNTSEGEHTYVVHAVSNRFGESAEGSGVSLSVVFPIMEAPENLSKRFINGNDIILDWDAVTYATSYKVYQVIDGEKVLQRTVTGTAVSLPNMPEGEYRFVVHSESNRFGESPVGSEISHTLIFPTMQAPENLTQSFANGNDIILRWNPSTYATAYYLYQIINGEKEFLRTVYGTAVALPNMPEGEYKFEVHSYSNRFSESPEGSEIGLTLVFPIMQAPENFTNSIANGNDIVLRWNASSYATAYNVYRIIDGEKELVRTLKGTATSFTNMPEGDYTYEVHSYSDRFGESPEGSSLSLNLVWPVVQPPLVEGEVFNVNNITLSWPSVAWANEYRVYKITNDERELIYKGTARSYKVYNLTEDTHSFEVTAYSNRFGESVVSNKITETIVYPIMEPPVASLKLLSETSARISWDFVTYANGYNIYEIIDGKPVLLAENVNNLSYTINNLTYANHLYFVTSYSNSFGESEPSNNVLAKLIIDTEAPVTTANFSDTWTNNGQTVNLSATDNETGVAKTYYSINGLGYLEGTTFTIEDEGIHHVVFYSVDKVGNVEIANMIEVKIDKTVPVTTSDAQATWSKEDVTVNLSTKDEHSGVAKTFYSINGSEFVEGTSFTVNTAGSNDVLFYSVDHAGNVEEVQKIEVKIDKTAPVVTMELVDEYQLGTSLELNYSAIDSLSGIVIEKMVVRGPNDLVGEVVLNGETIDLAEPGVYNLTVLATNEAGSTTTIEKQVVVYIPATIDVTAQNIKKNNGVITVRVDLPEGFDNRYFDLNTAKLNGVSALTSNNGYYNQAKNGQFKFERMDFNWTASKETVTFRCYLNGYLVVGKTIINVH
jgi:large repetitive protein